MKKIITLVAFVLTTVAFAQTKITEGVATIKATMSSTNEQVNAQLAMVGDMTVTTYFKGNKSRVETENPAAGKTVSIMDADANKMLVMMDNPMMGKKYMTKTLLSSEEELKDVKIEKTSETKKILGYDCVKYVIKAKNNGADVVMDVYVTDKISALSDQVAGFGNKMKGFPMYMEMKMNQMGMDMVIKKEVVSVKSEKVDDAKFDMTAPEGYTKMEMPTGK